MCISRFRRDRNLARGQMDIADVFGVAEQVASALKAAHGAGIVDRDIKPDNVLIRRDAQSG